jgi:hypothetical protein
LVINIGSNLDPPMPPENNKSIAVIAVEPILRTAARIPVHERLYTIVCAIANSPRFQIMNTYNAVSLYLMLLSLPFILLLVDTFFLPTIYFPLHILTCCHYHHLSLLQMPKRLKSK